jgi:hypothetical protein
MAGEEDGAAAQVMAAAMADFARGMAAQHELAVRIGRRTTQIIRFGMLGLVVLSLLMFYLVHALTGSFARMGEDMHTIAADMRRINGEVARMTGAVQALHGTVAAMEASVRAVPGLEQAAGGMRDSVQIMPQMQSSVDGLRQDMRLLNEQLGLMNSTVGGMGFNMHQLSKPMRWFPF